MELVLNSQCVDNGSLRRGTKIHKTIGDGETQCGKIMTERWRMNPPRNRKEVCKACFGNDDIFIVSGYELPD